MFSWIKKSKKRSGYKHIEEEENYSESPLTNDYHFYPDNDYFGLEIGHGLGMYYGHLYHGLYGHRFGMRYYL